MENKHPHANFAASIFGNLQYARRILLYKSGVSVDIISSATGLSKTELKKIGVK